MHHPQYLIRSVESLDPRYLRLGVGTDDVWVRGIDQATLFSADAASKVLAAMPPWYALACEIVPAPGPVR